MPKHEKPWKEEIAAALEALGGVASLSDLYAFISEHSTRQLTPAWQASIRQILELNSSDSANYRGAADLFVAVEGIGNGIWGLRDSHVSSRTAVDLMAPEPPGRVELTVTRIIRETKLSTQIKQLYRFRCQICGETLLLRDGKRYAEAHHIMPLGSPHNGADTAGNILCVCPNCHVTLDYGARPLQLDSLHIHPAHVIDKKCIEYHNSVICSS